jgi:hypothetical protein
MSDPERNGHDIWTDPRLVADPRIDHDDRNVHRVSETLHAAEPNHMHDAHTMNRVCIFCARRATLAVRAVGAARDG